MIGNRQLISRLFCSIPRRSFTYMKLEDQLLLSKNHEQIKQLILQMSHYLGSFMVSQIGIEARAKTSLHKIQKCLTLVCSNRKCIPISGFQSLL